MITIYKGYTIVYNNAFYEVWDGFGHMFNCGTLEDAKKLIDEKLR